MDEPRKNAYRYLLYWALLDIRQVAWIRVPWWNPFSWPRCWRHVRYAGRVADWLHNLAFFASAEFDGFDEDLFWDEVQSLEKRFPDFSPLRYRNVFEQRLEELTSGAS